MHYFYNELYLLALSHDEVVHGKKTIIDKLWAATRKNAPSCAPCILYVHPSRQKAELYGQRAGTFPEWDEKRELDWNLLEYPSTMPSRSTLPL